MFSKSAIVAVSLLAFASVVRGQEHGRDANQLPTVTILEKGAAPYQTLRYQLTKGEQSVLTMTTSMAMSQKIDGNPTPSIKTPAIQMVMDLHVVDVSSEGDAKYEFVLSRCGPVDEPGANPGMMSQLKSALNSMVGMKGSAIVTKQGFTEDANVEVPKGADALVKQQIEGLRKSINQFSSPLPEEPVGVGARWTVDSDMSMQGISFHQQYTMTLLSMDGDQIKVHADVTQSAPEQDVRSSALPGGAKLHLNSLHSTGEGMTELNLKQLLATSADVKNSLTQSLTYTASNVNQNIEQKFDLQMTIASDTPASSRPESAQD